MSRAIVFPGQGSQMVGMAKDFLKIFQKHQICLKKQMMF